MPAELRSKLAGIPQTVVVTPENADLLWQSRKDLFFKPAGGHGSKAVYRGDKVTRGVWTEIGRGGYVAQRFASPGERAVRLDGAAVARKMDVRLYTYGGAFCWPPRDSIRGRRRISERRAVASPRYWPSDGRLNRSRLSRINNRATMAR